MSGSTRRPACSARRSSARSASCSSTTRCSRTCPRCTTSTAALGHLPPAARDARARELLALVHLDGPRDAAAGEAVRRPAAARRGRPGAGARPEGAAARRAVLRRRPRDAAQAVPRAGHAAPLARDADRAGHARSRRGGGAGRPHLDPAPRPHAPVGPAARRDDASARRHGRAPARHAQRVRGRDRRPRRGSLVARLGRPAAGDPAGGATAAAHARGLDDSGRGRDPAPPRPALARRAREPDRGRGRRMRGAGRDSRRSSSRPRSVPARCCTCRSPPTSPAATMSRPARRSPSRCWRRRST